MARTKLGERLAFLARAGQPAAGPQPQPGEKAPSAAAAPHCAVPPAPEPLAPSAAQPLTLPAAPATAPLALSAAQPLASPEAPARAPSSSVTSVGEERGRKRAKPVQRYKVGLGFRLWPLACSPTALHRRRGLLAAADACYPCLQPPSRPRDYSRSHKGKGRSAHRGPRRPSSLGSALSTSTATVVAAAAAPAKPRHKPESGIPVDEPCDAKALIGSQFMVRGAWWKGATHTERGTLYPAQIVEYDASHSFFTRKRKADLTRVTIESFQPAIKFQLTRAQDQAWDNGNLWMPMKQYTEFGRKYDESLLIPEKGASEDTVLTLTSSPRESADQLHAAAPSSATVSGVPAAPTGYWQRNSAGNRVWVSAQRPPQRIQVLSMPDSYQLCDRCNDERKGRVSCWKTCGSKKLRRKLVATAAAATGAADKPVMATVKECVQEVLQEAKLRKQEEKASQQEKEKEWAPPGPADAKGQEAFEAAKRILKRGGVFSGKLNTLSSRIKWLARFAAALDCEHEALPRCLGYLERNLPWRAVTEDFGPNRPSFMHQLQAVRGPEEARVLLDTLAGFIRQNGVRGGGHVQAKADEGGNGDFSASLDQVEGSCRQEGSDSGPVLPGDGTEQSPQKKMKTMAWPASRVVPGSRRGAKRSQRWHADKRKLPSYLVTKRKTFASSSSRARVIAQDSSIAGDVPAKRHGDHHDWRGTKAAGRKVWPWPRDAGELKPGVNDSWNAYQSAHPGRQCLPTEWKAARLRLHEERARLDAERAVAMKRARDESGVHAASARAGAGGEGGIGSEEGVGASKSNAGGVLPADPYSHLSSAALSATGSGGGTQTDPLQWWLEDALDLSAAEATSVATCLSPALQKHKKAVPDALTMLTEEELGELLTPVKPFGVRALVKAALMDRKLAFGERMLQQAEAL